MRHLSRFQIQLIGKRSFVLKTVFSQDLGVSEKNELLKEIETKISSLLQKKNMENVSFELQEWEDLPVDPRSGKFPLVVRVDQNPAE
jgi:hypothetical protein